MIRGRAALYRALQVFFETEMCGLWRWQDAEHLPAEKADLVIGQRPNLFGKLKERVSIRFGVYDLSVESSHEAPPLGRVILNYPCGKIEGTMDPATWAAIGTLIKQQNITSTRTVAHG